MTNRRKFIAGLGALATGSAAATGTGAFTSVTADRNATVKAVSDAEALLKIAPQDTPNGNDYADTNSDGTVFLDFSENDSGGSGLNANAKTIIRDVLQVKNQGTQDVVVGVTNLPPSTSVYTDDGSVAANGTDTSLNQDASAPNSGNLALVEVGETMNDIGFIFRDPASDLNFDDSITFNAIAVDKLSDFDASQYPDNY